MSPPSAGSSRKPPAIEKIDLETDHDRRLGFALMRPVKEFTVKTSDRIVLMPGEKGVGWQLHIYHDPP